MEENPCDFGQLDCPPISVAAAVADSARYAHVRAAAHPAVFAFQTARVLWNLFRDRDAGKGEAAAAAALAVA